MKNFVAVAALSLGTLFGQAPPDQAWKVLKDGTAEKSADRRANAYHALGILTGNATARTMAEGGLSDPKGSSRAAAIDVLGQMSATTEISTVRNPKSGEALATMASDKKWLVRAAVVNSTANRGDTALLKAVIPLLGDVSSSGITGTLRCQ
jgi:HEAT repeat protein